MVSTFTPNIQLEEPARGDQVGTWDTPVNANMTLIDLVAGGTTLIPLAGAPVVLAAAQFQAKSIVFSSTLTANVTITFPTSFVKSYEVINVCTGTSAFTITLKTTTGNVICVPPGEFIDVVNLGSNFFYKNLGRVGSYWDHGGSSIPNWVSGCTVAPYLNCDGTAFSSAIYPNLANYLGTAVLPDSRGRARFTLNQATARVTAGISGIDGNTIRSGGGDENYAAHNHGATSTESANHTHTVPAPQNKLGTSGGGAAVTTMWNDAGGVSTTVVSAAQSVPHTHTVGTAGTGIAANVPPAYIGGITLIRAG